MIERAREHVPEAPGESTRAQGWLALAAGLTLALPTLARSVVENDMFWHLAIGRSLLEGGFPRTDPFGLGTEGAAWSPPEWLAELMMFVAYRPFGPWGLAVVQAVLVVLLGALVFLRARQVASACAPPDAAALHAFAALALTVVPASVHLGMRPLLVGHVLSALVLLELVRDRSGARTLVPVLPLVFVLWANLHPSWPLGVMFVWLELLGRLASGPLSRGWPVRFSALSVRRPLVVAALLSPFAALLRPDTLDGALYPFVHVVGLGDRMAQIIEWFPMSPTRPLHLFVGAITLATLALAVRAKKIAAPDLFVAFLSASLFARHQRFLPLFAIGVSPLLAGVLPTIEGTARLRVLTRSLPFVRGLAFVALLLTLVVLPTPALLDASVRTSMPEGATGWLETERGERSVRVFTTFEDGGYVVWRLPRARVYIDSRFDLYARSGVFDEYLAIRRGGGIAEVVSRLAIDAVMVPTPARDGHFGHLAGELSRLGWQEVFADENALLFVPGPEP